jgi:hypothetical protein
VGRITIEVEEVYDYENNAAGGETVSVGAQVEALDRLQLADVLLRSKSKHINTPHVTTFQDDPLTTRP